MLIFFMWILQRITKIFKNRKKLICENRNTGDRIECLFPLLGFGMAQIASWLFQVCWTFEIIIPGYITPAFNFWSWQGIAIASRWIVCSPKSSTHLRQLQAGLAYWLRVCSLKWECTGLSQAFSLNSLWLWTNYLTSLSFSFLICKIR